MRVILKYFLRTTGILAILAICFSVAVAVDFEGVTRLLLPANKNYAISKEEAQTTCLPQFISKYDEDDE